MRHLPWLLLLFGCGGSVAPVSSLDGTYSVTSFVCNGTPVVFAGQTTALVLSNGSATETYTSADCTNTITFTYTSNGTALDVAPRTGVCSPAACDHDITVDGTPLASPCVAATSAAGYDYQIVGNTLTHSTASCVQTWTKQ
jgi:hypothetical protein